VKRGGGGGEEGEKKEHERRLKKKKILWKNRTANHREDWGFVSIFVLGNKAMKKADPSKSYTCRLRHFAGKKEKMKKGEDCRRAVLKLA